MDNVPTVASAMSQGRLCFGTVDSWLLWHLTKTKDGEAKHLTDVTNASR